MPAPALLIVAARRSGESPPAGPQAASGRTIQRAHSHSPADRPCPPTPPTCPRVTTAARDRAHTRCPPTRSTAHRGRASTANRLPLIWHTPSCFPRPRTGAGLDSAPPHRIGIGTRHDLIDLPSQAGLGHRGPIAPHWRPTAHPPPPKHQVNDQVGAIITATSDSRCRRR